MCSVLASASGLVQCGLDHDTFEIGNGLIENMFLTQRQLLVGPVFQCLLPATVSAFTRAAAFRFTQFLGQVIDRVLSTVRPTSAAVSTTWSNDRALAGPDCSLDAVVVDSVAASVAR